MNGYVVNLRSHLRQ